MAKTKIEYLWKDRKRFLRLPLSTTKYRLSRDRLFIETGFFSTKYEEIVLYRVKDIALSRHLLQKMFGVGTVVVQSADTTCPVATLKNIKSSFYVKEQLHSLIEAAKIERRKLRVGDMVSGDEEDLVDAAAGASSKRGG